MLRKTIVVHAERDPEARVWFVRESDLPGLNLEADTVEALVEKLPGAILDLLEADSFGGEYGDTQEVPVELIAHASTKVSWHAAA
jgi:hypothetical protein